MVEPYNLFPECAKCTLESIGACTIAGDCKSCSNPEVNNKNNIIYSNISIGTDMEKIIQLLPADKAAILRELIMKYGYHKYNEGAHDMKSWL